MKVFAKDIMQKEVKTVRSDLSLMDLQRRFVDDNVSGFPVVGGDEGICGVVSISDLLANLTDDPNPAQTSNGYYESDERAAPAAVTEHLSIAGGKQPAAHLRVGDVMNPNVIAVTPDTSLHDVAALLSEKAIHRVLVMEKDQLVGLISTADVVRTCGQAEVDISFTAPKILDF